MRCRIIVGSVGTGCKSPQNHKNGLETWPVERESREAARPSCVSERRSRAALMAVSTGAQETRVGSPTGRVSSPFFRR
ncbi:hypothetical protein GDI0938 [Gluconacetobacter diazotrophicus PA1 5]|uniref:Uncharacterized protein n=1 Tax=Gluconacetobacter diazotrophicus (strain ATCC 49037 / DSM 5601 / CCUG 37298 / CIP 103539 / LMG 7603 / PAl5) TaxID=272568 RepID=A9HC08_GLUDA|nr:hypothetical protein GDI0938 [Gluconacetobacter diazotrophicus PA1 5]